MYKELNMIGNLYQWIEVNFEGRGGFVRDFKFGTDR